jgi:anti-sigma regulatory factor (Ser/Thr protein kinase)
VCAFTKHGWDEDQLEKSVHIAINEAASNMIQAGSLHLAFRITDSDTWTMVTLSGTGIFNVEKALKYAEHALDPDRMLKERGRGLFIMTKTADYVALTRDGDRIYLGFRKPRKRSSN